jgi:15-cis-phytoene synthase
MPPSSPERPFATADDHAACAALLRDGSRTFLAASLALPADTRRAATALYAFCRLADDAIDLGRDGVDALSRLRGKLDDVYGGLRLETPVDRAFADTVQRYAIPRELPEALLDGFQWDLEGRRYQTLGDLNAYAARVAGTVGAMMALVMGARSPEVVARACELGVAMQLTNIARDVGEDARRGRVYLPLEWLGHHGVDVEAWLLAPRHSAALGEVTERLLHYADSLYERAASGIAALPVACRPAMHAARLLYREIGAEVRRRGLDSVATRAVVPWTRKSQMLAAAAWAASRSPQDTSREALLETQFLVAAAAASLRPDDHEAEPAGIEGRLVSLIDLFLRLDERNRSNCPA